LDGLVAYTCHLKTGIETHAERVLQEEIGGDRWVKYTHKVDQGLHWQDFRRPTFPNAQAFVMPNHG